MQNFDGMETFERIRFLRKDLNLSQEKFGEILGVSRDVINNIESNRLKRPEQQEPLYRLIAEKFGVNLAWVKGESNEMHPAKTRGEEIGQIVRSAAQKDPEEAVSFFRGLLEGMSDAEILLMYEVFKRHFPTKE